MSDSDAPTPSHDAHTFAQRVQAEIVAAAERRRREDPRLARVEREIERAWATVAPPGAVGPTEELLLDRVDRLSMIDVDAPVGDRPGIRQVKGAIRKGTYWYLRYMSDQLNALHNVQARLLRRFDERLARVEAAAALDTAVAGLVTAAPGPGPAVGSVIAPVLAGVAGPVLVASCGSGGCVRVLADVGVEVYGIDEDPTAVLEGIDAGLDLRVDDPVAHLIGIEAATLGGVVVGGGMQRQPVAAVLELIDAAVGACSPGGVVAVAVEDRASRTRVDADLLAGRGVAPATWAHLLAAAGAPADVITEVDEAAIAAVVVARLP